MVIECRDGCFHSPVSGERRMYESAGRIQILCTTTAGEVCIKNDEYLSSLGRYCLEIWNELWSPHQLTVGMLRTARSL